MVGDEKKTIELSEKLYAAHRIFASPIVYPTVPAGTARIRLMPSALHSRKDLDYAVEAFTSAGRELGIIK